jgi:hypothetical protein
MQGGLMGFEVRNRMKKGFILLFLIFVTSGVYSEDHFSGRMIIFGWAFDEYDSSVQANNAINTILKYIEAARYQMISSERYNPSCQIGLYKSKYGHDRFYETVHIFITRDYTDDYYYRHIEVDFYNPDNAVLYKLILNSNDDYKWSEGTLEKNAWELVYKNEQAYDIFISWIERLKR